MENIQVWRLKTDQSAARQSETVEMKYFRNLHSPCYSMLHMIFAIRSLQRIQPYQSDPPFAQHEDHLMKQNRI